MGNICLYSQLLIDLDCAPEYYYFFYSTFFRWACDSPVSLLCPFLQFPKGSQPLAFGKLSLLVFSLTYALSVTSLPADIEKGKRKVVHVLGEYIFFHSCFLMVLIGKMTSISEMFPNFFKIYVLSFIHRSTEMNYFTCLDNQWLQLKLSTGL